MKKLSLTILSAALLTVSVAPSFAASSLPGDGGAMNQPRVILVDDWRHRTLDRRDGYHHSDWRDDRDYHHRHHHGNAGAIIGGLAAGAIIGGAIYSDRRDRYYDDGY